MLMLFKHSLFLLFITFFFLACKGSLPPAPLELHPQSYEKAYFKEHQKLSKNFKDTTISKWVQPHNHKKACKVLVRHAHTDRTLDESYTLNWDGGCKDGLAHGLGRVFETATLFEQSLLSIYHKGKINNVCFIERNLENLTLMGECLGNELDFNFDFSKITTTGTLNNFEMIKNQKIYKKSEATYHLVRKINDEIAHFDVEEKWGTYGNLTTPILIELVSPFVKKPVKQKLYENFAYYISDDFYGLFNQQDKAHGFSVPNPRGGPKGIEFNSGNVIKNVTYPRSYLSHLESISHEIYQAKAKAVQAYNQAKILKKQYQKKICQPSKSVSFMNNSDYKSICHEDKKQLQLQKKIQSKLATMQKNLD